LSLYYSDDHVTLYHGDCLTEHREWLEADVLVTDPPYGSENGNGYGRAGGNGRIGNAFIANDRTTEVRDAALAAWADRPVIAFGTPRMPEPPGGWDHRLVWDKREPGLNGGPWRYTHESIFVRGEGWARVSAASFSILSYPSGNGSPEKRDHVHAKPVALMMRLIEAAPPGAIADPFAGSGSTLIAAKNLGRKAIGVELEERYCEIIAKRCQQEVLDIFGGVA
jgi:site-specific DNA-methyltransferase (adenine-specific)